MENTFSSNSFKIKKRESFDNSKGPLLINLYQNKLHKMINSYLNGYYLTKYSIYLYPFIEKHSIKLNNDLMILISYLEKIQKIYGYDLTEIINRVKINANNKRCHSFTLANIIAQLYSVLKTIISPQRNLKKVQITCKNEFIQKNYQVKDKKYLKPVVHLRNYANKNLKQYLLGFYIHGSMATLDYIKGASDFDTMIIVNEETVLNADRLLKLKNILLQSLRYLYMIDPLQHHGHLTITEIDMSYYPQSYFPFILFDYATVILGQRHLNFFERNSDRESRDALWRMCQQDEDRTALKQTLSKLYTLKYFLSIILLIPSIFLQVFDNPCYKKFSFQKVKIYFDDEIWKIVRKASKIRESLIYDVPVILRIMSNLIPNPFFLSLYYKRFKYKVPPYILETLGESYIEESFRFKQQILNIMKNDAKLSG